jgi:hypothetical protein
MSGYSGTATASAPPPTRSKIVRAHTAHPLLPNSFHADRRRALTLIELLIAVAITAFISAVLAVLIHATAMGTNSQNDGRRSLVKMQGLKAQIEDTVTNAQCVLATGTNYIVLWRGDLLGAATPVNSAVNLSELQLLEVDTATGNVNLYTTAFPAGWSSSNIISADTTYAASTAWYAACTTAKAGSYFPATTIATNATGMTASLDTATTTAAKLVSIVITFTDATGTDRKLVIAAGLQNQTVPW